MGYGIKLEIWGDFALFSRPEMKVERVSYDVITASAARGIIESIYWKPAIKWEIEKIHVLNPISFTNIRRNERKSKISANKLNGIMGGNREAIYSASAEDIVQRASMILQNVRYVIEASFQLTDKAGELDTVEKHYAIASRRMRNGQCFHNPSFGCREFPVNFRLVEEGETVKSIYDGTEIDLGFMLYDMDFSDLQNIVPTFCRPVMRNGIIDFAECGVVK